MKKFTIIIFLTASLFAAKAQAQQTIFNVPSADVTEKNKNFLQHESQFRTKDPDQFINTTNYFARGIGSNTELDATLFNLGSPASKNASLGLGFKSVLPIHGDAIKNYQPKIIIGSQIPFSLQGNGVGHWIYSAGSVTLPQTNSRFTAGISSGTRQIFAKNVNCFIGGFEQKITQDLTFINDWYSGNHAAGVFASGFSHPIPYDLMLFAGYQIPNSKKAGRNALVIEIAKIF